MRFGCVNWLYIYTYNLYYSKVNLARFLETLLCSLSLFLFPRVFFILPDPLPQNKNGLGKRTTHPATFPSFCAWVRWQEGGSFGNKVLWTLFTLQPIHTTPWTSPKSSKTSIAKKNSFNSKKLNKKMSTSTGLVGDRHHDDHWERVESHQNIPWVHRTRRASHIIYIYIYVNG